jgi:uncharacterized protein with ParB-like and HNH nuclease domain
MNTRAERSSYTPIDFLEWQQSGSLLLTPKFQRRHVWSTPARSYLIDTLLLGMPVPPIYMRVVQSAERDKVIREVIDGQQRISSVLDFVGGRFALSKNIESPFAGKRFGDLPQTEQNKIRHYSFICEVFHGVEDADVLSIFARLNTHSVKLNAQELRNGRWFGHFKQLSYRLAFEHLEMWKRMRIFTDARIARMAEVEFTSELLIFGIDGLQDKKKSIDDFYEEYDENFKERTGVADRFRTTIDAIIRSCEDVLPESEFRRSPLFYSLYGTIYHRLFGVPNLGLKRPTRAQFSAQDEEAVAAAVRNLSELIVQAKTEDGNEVPKKYQKFVTACLRAYPNNL